MSADTTTQRQETDAPKSFYDVARKAWHFFKKTYSCRKRTTYYPSVLRVLRGRALVGHFLNDLSLAILSSIGSANWTKENCLEDPLTDLHLERCNYNRELLDPILPAIKVMIIVMCWTGVALTPVIYKFPVLTKLILPYNLVIAMIILCVPDPYYVPGFYTGLFALVEFVAFYQG